MANKVAPKISSPGSSKFPTKGPHNPNVGTHGSGIAPRNASAGQRTDRLSMPQQGGIARVANVPNAPKAGSFIPPINNAMANQKGNHVGQAEALPPGPGSFVSPMSSSKAIRNPVATAKPKRKGGAAFYGET